MIAITGARVLTATGLEACDVLIEGHEVAEVGAIGSRKGARVIDGTGMVLGPGLVDLHVHFREPGQEWKEDIQSGSRAAAAGGFTAVVVMPNTIPAIDGPDLVVEVEERGKAVGLVDVAAAGAITAGRKGESLADLEGMYRAGARVFSDDGDCVADVTLVRKAMSLLRQLPGALYAEHAEDVQAGMGGQMHDGEISRGHGLVGLSSRVESDIVARDIEVAVETGAPLHLQHLSTADAVDLVRSAKASGIAVSAEVTPHHLTLTEEALRHLDPDLKMYPPLRSEVDRQALVRGLEEGVIDAVASDHAPHAQWEKKIGFELAPRGVIGLETAMPLTLDALAGDLVTMFHRMSLAPARLAGMTRHGNAVIPGAPANLTLVDPVSDALVSGFASKASNSPFLGTLVRGAVMATIFEGRVVYEGGRIE